MADLAVITAGETEAPTTTVDPNLGMTYAAATADAAEVTADASEVTVDAAAAEATAEVTADAAATAETTAAATAVDAEGGAKGVDAEDSDSSRIVVAVGEREEEDEAGEAKAAPRAPRDDDIVVEVGEGDDDDDDLFRSLATLAVARVVARAGMSREDAVSLVHDVDALRRCKVTELKWLCAALSISYQTPKAATVQNLIHACE